MMAVPPLLETICQYTKRESLCPRDRFVAVLPVSENARNIHDFSDPAAVFLAFHLSCEITHAVYPTSVTEVPFPLFLSGHPLAFTSGKVINEFA